MPTEQDAGRPNPTYIEAGNRAALWLAKRTGGIAQSMVLEALANIPSTAHILGGAVIGARRRHRRRRRPQPRLRLREPAGVRRGSTVPANPGVNPSLTITALAEHAMSHVPAKAAP